MATVSTPLPIDEVIRRLQVEILALEPQDDETDERFDRFVVSRVIKQKIDKGLKHYEDCDDRAAGEVLNNAYVHLRGAQLSYFKGACERRFNPDLEALIKQGLDESLANRVRKFIRAVRDLAGKQSGEINLTEAGDLYNRAVEAIYAAEDEMRRLAKVRRERAEREQAEADREAAALRRAAAAKRIRETRQREVSDLRQLIAV